MKQKNLAAAQGTSRDDRCPTRCLRDTAPTRPCLRSRTIRRNSPNVSRARRKTSTNRSARERGQPAPPRPPSQPSPLLPPPRPLCVSHHCETRRLYSEEEIDATCSSRTCTSLPHTTAARNGTTARRQGTSRRRLPLPVAAVVAAPLRARTLLQRGACEAVVAAWATTTPVFRGDNPASRCNSTSTENSLPPRL